MDSSPSVATAHIYTPFLNSGWSMKVVPPLSLGYNLLGLSLGLGRKLKNVEAFEESLLSVTALQLSHTLTAGVEAAVANVMKSSIGFSLRYFNLCPSKEE